MLVAFELHPISAKLVTPNKTEHKIFHSFARLFFVATEMNRQIQLEHPLQSDSKFTYLLDILPQNRLQIF